MKGCRTKGRYVKRFRLPRRFDAAKANENRTHLFVIDDEGAS